jgi:hypothetical protein
VFVTPFVSAQIQGRLIQQHLEHLELEWYCLCDALVSAQIQGRLIQQHLEHLELEWYCVYDALEYVLRMHGCLDVPSGAQAEFCTPPGFRESLPEPPAAGGAGQQKSTPEPDRTEELDKKGASSCLCYEAA